MQGPVRVTQTVRIHEDTGERYVRVIGDGTPENIQLLDMQGERISEIVLRIEITIAAGQCARGVFTYYLDPQPEGHESLMDATGTFEAWVVLEPPPAPPRPPSELERENAELRERIAAAAFALGVESGGCAAPCDARVPGPSASELLEIGDVDVTTERDPATGELIAVDVRPRESD